MQNGKRQEIETSLRSQIVGGAFPTGGRLPTRTELERQFRASRVTVQRALNCLIEGGFVQARGKLGTFVSEHPPHLCCYGMVFLSDAADLETSLFYRSLAAEAETINADDTPRRVRLYFRSNDHTGSEQDQELVTDVLTQQVAGLIFTTQCHYWRGSPVLEHPGMPRIAIMTKDADMPALRVVDFDGPSFMDNAFRSFAERGRRRLALITCPGNFASYCRSIRSRTRGAPLSTRDYWLHQVSLDYPAQARQLSHLLVHKKQKERPDALIIGDDNLAEHVVQGLMDAGVRIPEELDVIAHCNLPLVTKGKLPIRHLGYDVREVLKICTDSIDRQRMGGSLKSVTRVSAKFKDNGNYR
ncbi:MAG: substrate-binding domain-containing protein [Planctomycetota bacterium]|nr:substrate-binding domain-containing protein [Planctomycetota bacterium]